MERRRDNYDVNPTEKSSLTKRTKNNDSLLHSETLKNGNSFTSPGSSKLSAQSPSVVFPNRKRRSRNSQQMCEADSSTHCSTTNADGPLRKRSDLSCVVCCAVAYGYNFDAISCESCKAFFRRNALFSLDRLKCRRDGTCEITLETRRRCKSCRLKKCFNVGMRKEWILTEEEKVNKKRRIEENRKLRVSNADDPTLLSENSLAKNDPDLKSLLNKTEKPPLQLISSLRSDDLIASIVKAYNDGVTVDLMGYGWSYPLARKITGLYQLINMRSNTALRLISFFKRVYDFDILDEADKINLVKTNLPYVFFLHISLTYDPAHDVYHQENTSDKPVYGEDIREAYGIDGYTGLTKVMRALNSIIQVDKRIIHVALVILLFSKGLAITVHGHQRSLNNHQQIFQTQNKYAEQLWLFIEKTYGGTRAVKVFATLIGKCLIMQEITNDIQNNVFGKLNPYDVPSILRSFMRPV